MGVRSFDSIDPITLDGSSAGAAAVVDLAFGSLTAIDAKGEVVADLAIRWSSNEAATEWRFELDPDARFADGGSVTSEAVVRSLRRAAIEAPRHMTLAMEPVDGYTAAIDASDPSLFTGISADDDEVVVRLTRPDGAVPRWLAAPVFGVVGNPEKLIDGTTGDFDVKRQGGVWKLGDDSLTLSVATVESDDDLETGIVDGTIDLGFTSAESARLQPGMSEKRVPVGALRYAALNTLDPTLTNATVRTAVVGAVNEGSFVSSLTYAEPVGEPLCPNLCTSARNDDIDLPHSLEVLHLGGPDGDVAAIIVEQLSRAGVDAAAVAVAPDAFGQRVAKGEFQIALMGWLPTARDDVSFLRPLLHSDGVSNLVGLASDELDVWFAANDLHRPVDLAAVAEQAAIAPLFRDHESLLLAEASEDVEIGPDGALDFTDIGD